MKKKTGSEIEQLTSWQRTMAAEIDQLIDRSVPRNVTRGMALELTIEVVESALEALWSKRRMLGALSSTMPEPQCSTNMPRNTTEPRTNGIKRRGRKTKDKQVISPVAGPEEEPRAAVAESASDSDEFTLN